ncbi:RNA polymerase sigma factor [Phenylobacterium ferrooxidans]|uniref:RNA polymerase sigma factor n=1 Tax=Phenylobacterium ferrooxidans TaxID=2982689 RepID=A0ABW6CLC6_9CAUL
MTAGEETDDELVLRALGGEDRAFTTLMQRHQAPLYGFARRYVGDSEAAGDVVQEAFVAAWKALTQFDSQRSFPVWLRAIALNKCRDRARRLAVRKLILGEKSDQSFEAQAQPDPAPDGEESVLLAERRAVVQQAIDRLPVKLKEPLLLTYFDELTQQEVASLLGVTVKTIETRVYRARQQLAEILDRSAISDKFV